MEPAGASSCKLFWTVVDDRTGLDLDLGAWPTGCLAALLGVARPCAETGKEISRREGWENMSVSIFSECPKPCWYLPQLPVLALVED